MTITKIKQTIQKIIEEEYFGADEFWSEPLRAKLFSEVFKNPTSREIRSIEKFQESDIGGIRLGYSYATGDLYAWDGLIFHDEIIDYVGLALLRMSYSRGVVEAGWNDFENIVPRINGGREQLISKLQTAFPGLKKIMSEHRETIWRR
jgi:hypothetical protein